MIKVGDFVRLKDDDVFDGDMYVLEVVSTIDDVEVELSNGDWYLADDLKVVTTSVDLRETDDQSSHYDFKETATKIGRLVSEKNKAYGDSFNKSGNFLELLYPNGIKPEQYTDMLGIVRVFDKMMRIANSKNAFGENPWEDITGYGILKSTIDATEE